VNGFLEVRKGESEGYFIYLVHLGLPFLYGRYVKTVRFVGAGSRFFGP